MDSERRFVMLAILLEAPVDRLERVLDLLGEGELTDEKVCRGRLVLGLPIQPESYLANPQMFRSLGCQPKEVREQLEELGIDC